jgi:hypothetical protein
LACRRFTDLDTALEFDRQIYLRDVLAGIVFNRFRLKITGF